jgi:hypothetical protein
VIRHQRDYSQAVALLLIGLLIIAAVIMYATSGSADEAYRWDRQRDADELCLAHYAAQGGVGSLYLRCK